ncbi:MAG: carboxypeptidase-like regulatory domain-containing protein [Bryobacteraceae bacterium]|jgi:hypothetical protein
MIRILTLYCALAACAAAQAPAAIQPIVTGRTVDEDEKPVRKAALTLLPLATTPTGDPLAPYGVVSDANGGFEFYGVPDGRYQLMAERAGYVKTFYGARNVWATGSILTLRAGAPVTGLILHMIAQAVISGTVTAGGESIYPAGVTVYQIRYQGGRRQWVRADSIMNDPDGSFSFNKLTAGRYRLSAQALLAPTQTAPGHAPESYAVTYYPGVVDAGAAEAIEVRRGQTVSDLRLPVLQTQVFSISGSIAPKSPASARVMVRLRTDFSDRGLMMTTGDQFRFDSVMPGSYSLSVFVSDQDAATSRPVAYESIQVSAGDLSGLSVDLDPEKGIQGTIGGAPEGVKLRVSLVPEGTSISYPIQADVKPDGSFLIQGSYVGRFQIKIDGLPQDAYVKSAAYAKNDALDELVLGQTNPDDKLEIAIGRGAPRLAGVVSDDKGAPLDAVVTLIPDPPQPQRQSLYRLVQTDENGRFEFQALRPGKYRLYAWQEFEPGAQFDSAVTEPLQSLSVPIDLAEGDRKAVNIGRISVDQAAAAYK